MNVSRIGMVTATILGLLSGGVGLAQSANSGNLYTGCLNPAGQLKEVAIGATPLKPCGGNEILIMAIDPNFQAQASNLAPPNRPQIAPEAAGWQTWVLASSDELRPPPPAGRSRHRRRSGRSARADRHRRCRCFGRRHLLERRFALLSLD